MKLFVSDIDHTLYDPIKKSIHQKNVDALIALQQQGIKVALATGRIAAGAYHVAKLVELDKFDGYIIASNGAQILHYDHGELKEIHAQRIDRKIIFELLDLAKQFNCDFACEQDGYMVANAYNRGIEYDLTLSNIDVLISKTRVEEYIKKDSLKCQFTGEEENMIKLHANLPDSSGCEFFEHGAMFIDAASVGINKAIGIDVVCEHIGIDFSDVAAIGDADNDIAMLKKAAISAAVSNAKEEVLSIVDHVVPSVEAAGVAEFAKMFLSV